MRKKSHISLAKGIIHGLDLHDRIHNRLAFYIGSIWPDCTPSFITKRHCIDETFDIFIKKMERFLDKFNPKKDMNMAETLRMGIVMHYIADYFTFPHNKHYPGTLKDHCVYEEVLKKRMYQFIAAERSKTINTSEIDLPGLSNIKQITNYIKKKHAQYMELEGNVDNDCLYSFKACKVVFASLLSIAERENMGIVPVI